MSYGTDRAKYESELAAAHRRLFNAAEAARRMNDLHAEQRVERVLVEVTLLAQESLMGRARFARRQDSLPGV